MTTIQEMIEKRNLEEFSSAEEVGKKQAKAFLKAIEKQTGWVETQVGIFKKKERFGLTSEENKRIIMALSRIEDEFEHIIDEIEGVLIGDV